MGSDLRITLRNDAPVRPEREFVAYWMCAQRRPTFNFGLQRAVRAAQELERPLIVLEAVSASYRWSSARMHAFVLEGMEDNRAWFEARGVTYHAYVEPAPHAGRGLHAALGARAALYVTDDWPCFEIPHYVERVARALDVRLEAVDSCGLLPLRAAQKAAPTAYAFRRVLQRELPKHLPVQPLEDPLAKAALAPSRPIPAEIARRFPAYDPAHREELLENIPFAREVPPATLRGGHVTGRETLERFISKRLGHYGERNRVDRDFASGLSPWLHFGHVGAHQVLAAVAAVEGWSPADVNPDVASGKREGWWGMSAPAEAFLDELVTWRELGLNMCQNRPDDYDRYESLPDWARTTLAEHADDPRDPVYDLEQFAAAATHDELWNAAQNQLRTTGVLHNYMRMLWGKKILHWSRSPREAFDIMVELNNRYALDGRDPNSYSGIAWTLGRYDRPWGPERPIFGKIRYMTSDNTRRKLDVKSYVARFGSPTRTELF